jgi:septin family protein
MTNKVKKYSDFLKEAVDDANSNDANLKSLQNNTATYKKYQNNIISMFNNAKVEDMEKINKDFENFINGLSESEKGASDMLRALFSSEKIKMNIKGLEEQKKNIDLEIQERIKELKQITDNLNKKA